MGYLRKIECQTIGINAKQQDWEASGLCWHDQGSFKQLQKPCFTKGGPHEPCVSPPLLLTRISKFWYLRQIECQTIGINAKQQDLGSTGLCWHNQGSSKELQKPCFAKSRTSQSPQISKIKHAEELFHGILPWTSRITSKASFETLIANTVLEFRFYSPPIRNHTKLCQIQHSEWYIERLDFLT